MNLNKALIIGNLTRDPEVRTTPSGQVVASFGVATNRRWTDRTSGERKEQTEYHNVVCWGKLAEIAGQYLKKGSKVYVEGRLQTRSWDDQSGVKRYRTEIIVENFIMLDRREPSSVAPSREQAAPTEAKPSETPPSDQEINVEDIPF